MAKTIQLTKGYSTLVDDDDYEMLSKFSWYAQANKGKVYARRSFAIPGTRKKGKQYLHKLLMPTVLGQIDHIDGDSLNNQRNNLRVATGKQNQWNAKVRSDNKSGRKGVQKRLSRSKKSDTPKWVARCARRYLGVFDNIEEAAVAYDCAAIATFGRHSRTNFDQMRYATGVELIEAIDKGWI